MNNTFPKDIMDCMKDCILSIFWPKKKLLISLRIPIAHPEIYYQKVNGVYYIE